MPHRINLTISHKLIPFWLSLWLLSSFGGPAAAWQHFDGTFCAPCTSSPRAPVLDDDCESESPAVGAASDDCRKCCAPISQSAPDKLISQSLQVALPIARFVFKAPIRRETRLSYAFTQSYFDALPRPMPRGRAPPVWFSVSPFCTPEI